MNKIAPELARQEVIALLDEMEIDTDIDSMTEEDAKDFNELLKTLTKPVETGRAIVDGDTYVLTLKKPISEEETTATIKEPTGLAWELIDRAKKGEDIKKLLRFAEGFTGIPYAQIRNMPNSDLKVLRGFAQLFLA